MVNDLKYASVSLTDILNFDGRLEASVFNIEAKHARELIRNSKWKIQQLNNLNLVSSISYPGRFKRNYVDKAKGQPFILPSQITEVNPQPTKWIYGIEGLNLLNLTVSKGDLLLTRSGTIGRCTLVSNTLAGRVMSDDLIRIIPHKHLQGYLYTFLTSKTGQLLLKTANYGAVIQHIEPAHLEDIPVPIASDDLIAKINDAILESFSLRDESNILILNAQLKLIGEIGLPPLEKISGKQFHLDTDLINFNVSIDETIDRVDASYYNPRVRALEDYISQIKSIQIEQLDSQGEIYLPGQFKRVYVEKGFGIPFFSGRSIGELDPLDKKYLSFSQHGKQIKQLSIEENMLLITCSGTIGNVALVPKHWDSYAMTHDIIRIRCLSPEIAAYCYAWLSSEYGKCLILKHSYGAVVQHIEDHHLATVPIPICNKKIRDEISQLILSANDKRYQAFLLEQQALELFNSKVLGLT